MTWATEKYSATTNLSYQFGIDLNADWKGFDFRAFFQGVMKRDYWQGSAYFGEPPHCGILPAL